MTVNTEYEAIRSRAQLFKAGSIIPRRVLKCHRRSAQHLLKFYNDTYVIPGPTGYVCFMECDPAFVMRLDKPPTKLGESFTFTGSPYQPGGTHWFGQHDVTVEQFRSNVVEAMKPYVSKVRWLDNCQSEVPNVNPDHP